MLQELRDEALRVVALRAADVPEHARSGGELLTTLQVSKACLVCHGWQRIFCDPRLHASLDCEELTRQGFLRELRRRGCVLVSLHIGSRAHWACARNHLGKLKRQKQIDLTDTLLAHQRE